MKHLAGLPSLIGLVIVIAIGSAEAIGTTVEVTGYARVFGGDVETARAQAMLNAQKKALEMATGAPIGLISYYESDKALMADEAMFRKNVVERVGRDSSGFVSQFRILEQTQVGEVLRLKMAVRLEQANVMREVAIIQRRISGARFPKLMFVVSEDYINQAKEAVQVRDPALLSTLEDAFLKAGFDLVAKEEVEKLRREESIVFQEMLKDDAKAAEIAMRFGAEYVVFANGHVRHTGFNSLGLNEHHAHAEVSVRTINASTGAVVTSNKETGNSDPNCYNEEDLRIRLIEKVSRKSSANIVKRLLASWDRETENGIRYSVKVYKVKSYKRQGRKILTMLRSLDGVREVKKISYGGGRLEIEIFYTPLRDVSALESAIIDASENYKAIKNLDVKFSRGRELSFHL